MGYFRERRERDLKIVYIAGYGRSGSTVLERVISSNPSIRAAGELRRLGELSLDPRARCSCDAPLRECGFWGPVIEEIFGKCEFVERVKTYYSIQLAHESWRNWRFLGMKGWMARGPGGEYVDLSRRMLMAIQRRMGPEEKFLVDSSKTAYMSVYRPQCLARTEACDIHVIHLVRDCRGVVWSIKRGLNRDLEKGVGKPAQFAVLRAILGWSLANVAANRLREFFPENRYLRIRYEDLTSRTEDVLKKIGQFLGVQFESEIMQTEEGVDTHQIGGNRIRFRKMIQIAADKEWEASLGWCPKVFTKLITYPLSRGYGY